MGQLFFIPPASAGGVGSGNVTGPAGATDSALALYDGITGTLIKNSVVIVDGAGNMTVPGLVDGRDIAADGAKLDTIATGATDTPLSAVAPVDVTKAAASVGVAVTAARADHKHDITTAAAVGITDSTNAEGVATTLARSDHTHAHGSLSGGSLHADVIAGGASGFMTGADKTKLDGFPASAVPTSRTLTAGAGLTGGGDLSADRTFAAVANADGSIVVNPGDIQVGVLATDAQHGLRGGGTLHADVIAAGASGFMSGADKSKLDGISAGAAALTGSAPVDVTKAAAAVGVAVTAARADHKHDITTAAANTITVGAAAAEGVATTLARSDHTHALTAPGAPADVTKAAASAGASTSVARADHKHDISTATVLDITDSTNAEGTATSPARSDHTHSHGTRGGGSLHALVVAGGAAGFMSGADKTKLDGLPAATATAVMAWGANSEAATTTTRYLFPWFGDGTASTTPIQIRAPRAGTLRNLRVRHNTPAGNGNLIVYTVRLNGVNTLLAVSMASTASDGSNLVTSVAVAAGDLLGIEVTKVLAVGTSPGDITATAEFA